MRFLLKWLRVERPPGVTLHPTRVVRVALQPDAAYARCVHVVGHVLGGHVTSEDPPRQFEASFGLVNSERITVSIEAAEEGDAVVRLQSRRLAGAQPTQESAHLSRFERELST